MSRFLVATLIVAFAGTTPTFGQQAATDNEDRVAWLKEHAIRLRSIDPGDEDFSDLEPLRKAIGNARIVQLGEQQHTDGATLLAKTRLIKFLHQRMGFDVLAFESSLYDCRKAWELLRQGHDPYDSVRQGVFGIWTGTEQFQPLINYLGQHARGDHPLELCGFDCNFSGRGANGRIIEDLRSLLKQLSAEGFDDELRESLVTGIESLSKNEPAPEPAVLEQRRRALEAFSKALANQHATRELRTEELAYWRQLAKCIETVMVQHWLSPYRDDDVAGQVRSENRRDAQMAANLVWLAREVFPARKIITWAASSHLSRNRFRLEPVDRKEAEEYKLSRDMGNGVWKELGEETYTVAFLSGEGHLSWGKVPLPAPGSMEDLFQRVGIESGFLDLRKLNDSGQWLRQPVIARPMGYVNYRGDWTSVFDGFVFIRTQYSSSPAQRIIQARAAAREEFTEGWTGPKKGSSPYEVGIDTTMRHGGQQSAYLKRVREVRSAASLTQICSADDYRRKRLRMSAYVKTEGVIERTGLAIRIHGKDLVGLAWDNMSGRPIVGTTDWTKYELVLDVPADAVELSFGVELRGAGQVWVDDFQFETVGQEVATTGLPTQPQRRQGEMSRNLPKEPRNLGFEQ